MKFEWDDRKNKSNILKHGVSFEKAKEIFQDPMQLSVIDHRFNYYDERWITIGMTIESYLLVVAHLYFDVNGEETIRIISARNATNHERRQYEYER